MYIWKMVLVLLTMVLFVTCKHQKQVTPELQQAWQEVSQEQDIYAKAQELQKKAEEYFDQDQPDVIVTQYEMLADKEEKRILKVQSLIESASSDQLNLLIK